MEEWFLMEKNGNEKLYHKKIAFSTNLILQNVFFVLYSVNLKAKHSFIILPLIKKLPPQIDAE